MTGERAPGGVDTTTPSVARIYDFFLDGKDNFAVDRAAAAQIEATDPEVRLRVRENRAFLGRAVRYLVDQGVRQFLDVGTGLPTQENVHQVARDARVVYVDNDPIVLSHARALLAGTSDVAIVAGDVRDPGGVLDDPETRRLIDFTEPVAILLVAILHFVPDADDPDRLVAGFRERMAPGSHLVLSHATTAVRTEGVDRAVGVYDSSSAGSMTLREKDRIGGFFTGLDLVEPGLVHVAGWRPPLAAPLDTGKPHFVGGVARKP